MSQDIPPPAPTEYIVPEVPLPAAETTPEPAVAAPEGLSADDTPELATPTLPPHTESQNSAPPQLPDTQLPEVPTPNITPEVPQTSTPSVIEMAVARYSAEDRAKARAAKQEKKEAMLAAMLSHALELHEQRAVLTNDAVQEMTGLSDTTCTVYLRELVARGFLVRHGKGRGVRYELVL